MWEPKHIFVKMNSKNYDDDYNLIVDEEIYETQTQYNKSKFSLNSSFSIFHSNIRSINKNINSLEMYVQLLDNAIWEISYLRDII